MVLRCQKSGFLPSGGLKHPFEAPVPSHRGPKSPQNPPSRHPKLDHNAPKSLSRAQKTAILPQPQPFELIGRVEHVSTPRGRPKMRLYAIFSTFSPKIGIQTGSPGGHRRPYGGQNGRKSIFSNPPVMVIRCRKSGFLPSGGSETPI